MSKEDLKMATLNSSSTKLSFSYFRFSSYIKKRKQQKIVMYKGTY